MGPLASLTSLRYLFLEDNDIVYVSPLAFLTRLVWLELGGNKVVDVSPLASLSTLRSLDLRGNEIQDISPLVDSRVLTHGDTLYLQDNPLSDQAIKEQIPALRALGIVVILDSPAQASGKIAGHLPAIGLPLRLAGPPVRPRQWTGVPHSPGDPDRLPTGTE